MQHLCVMGAILSLRRYYHSLFGTMRRHKLFMSTIYVVDYLEYVYAFP